MCGRGENGQDFSVEAVVQGDVQGVCSRRGSYEKDTGGVVIFCDKVASCAERNSSSRP